MECPLLATEQRAVRPALAGLVPPFILRDAHAGSQLGKQPSCPPVTAGRGRRHERAMPHLASRPRLLAIIMQMQPFAGEQPLAGRDLADQIHHGAESHGAGGPEGQAEYGAQVILELAGDATLDGPVSGVMYTRRHLVGDEAAVADEEFDGEHANITEVCQAAPEIAGREALPAGWPVRRAGEAQNTV